MVKEYLQRHSMMPKEVHEEEDAQVLKIYSCLRRQFWGPLDPFKS